MAGTTDAPRSRRPLIAILVAVALAAGGAWAYRSSTRPVHLTTAGERLLADAPAAARDAGCTGVRTVPDYPGGLDRAHIGASVPSPPPLSTYPSTPPASGPHDPTPLDAGTYENPPPVYRAIHSLEHGAVVVWLQRAAMGDVGPIAQIRSDLSSYVGTDHVIVAPYDYPAQGEAGRLPEGRLMVLVAWHRIQLCRSASLAVAVAFIRWYSTPSTTLPFGAPRGYRGVAPEAGLGI